MPPLTRFIDGTGPVFAGKIFPFAFITIACGAISGFHSLISSGTTPKLIRARNAKPHGRIWRHDGGVAGRDHGDDRRLRAAAGHLLRDQQPGGYRGHDAEAAAATISSWGFPVTAADMQALGPGRGRADALQPHRRRTRIRRRHGAHLFQLARRRKR